LVETKKASKRGSSIGIKKPGAASARPLIHSSHGSHGTHSKAAASARSAADGAEIGLPSAVPGKRTTRLKVSKAKDAPAPARAPRTKADGAPTPRLRKTKSPGSGPSESMASDEARQLAVDIATAALDKKAVGLEVLDVAGKVDYADFLVLMTGRSDRQVQALAQGIEAALQEKGKRPLSVEGLPHASWVLMDFGDVVVHVFQDDARSSYDLDGLWMDARRIPLPIPEELR